MLINADKPKIVTRPLEKFDLMFPAKIDKIFLVKRQKSMFSHVYVLKDQSNYHINERHAPKAGASKDRFKGGLSVRLVGNPFHMTSTEQCFKLLDSRCILCETRVNSFVQAGPGQQNC